MYTYILVQRCFRNEKILICKNHGCWSFLSSIQDQFSVKENGINGIILYVFFGRYFHCKAIQYFYFSCTKVFSHFLKFPLEDLENFFTLHFVNFLNQQEVLSIH